MQLQHCSSKERPVTAYVLQVIDFFQSTKRKCCGSPGWSSEKRQLSRDRNALKYHFSEFRILATQQYNQPVLGRQYGSRNFSQKDFPECTFNVYSRVLYYKLFSFHNLKTKIGGHSLRQSIKVYNREQKNQKRSFPKNNLSPLPPPPNPQKREIQKLKFSNVLPKKVVNIDRNSNQLSRSQKTKWFLISTYISTQLVPTMSNY